MNLCNIPRAFRQMRERGWDTLYWCIDLHDCIIPTRFDTSLGGYCDSILQFYEGAEETLKMLSDNSKMCLILWSSSYDKDLNDVLEWIESHGIHFDYLNENPEAQNNDKSCFNKKFYFNILIDDKAGFEASTDWNEVLSFLHGVDNEEQAAVTIEDYKTLEPDFLRALNDATLQEGRKTRK